MIDLTSEKEIEKAIEHYFTKGGWVRQREEENHGVDLRLWHSKHRKYWFIEVKRTYTTKNKKSQTYVNTATAIGQIIYRMNQKRAGFYGIGVPDTELFAHELGKIPLWIKKSLKLYVFFVDKKGNIRKVTPNQKIQHQ